MFQLTLAEWENIKLQFASNSNWSQIVTSSKKHRGDAYLPYVFTEQGVSMLSGILRSNTAIEVNIAIMRAFVFMRQYALTHKDLTTKLDELEKKYYTQFLDVYEV